MSSRVLPKAPALMPASPRHTDFPKPPDFSFFWFIMSKNVIVL